MNMILTTMTKTLLALISFLLVSLSSFAQLVIVNPNDNTASLAVGHYVDKGLFKGWNTIGWINIAPHDSATVLPSVVGNTFYYYGRLSGCEQTFEGQYSLYLHQTEAFKVSNAATEAPISLNNGVVKAAFSKVELPKDQTQFRYVLPSLNCTANGKREGKWTILLDRDKEETLSSSDAAYIRKISYQNGKPTGIVRDYFYPSNQLQWDGKLIQTNPDVKHGTSITYNERGRKREEATYNNGKLIGSILRWDEEGNEILTKKTYKAVTVLPPQTGYLFSYYNTGKSRAVIPVNLPSNTVLWYYEFTASRDKSEMLTAQNKFKLVADLTNLVDQSGISNLAMTTLTTPPGGNICNVSLITDSKQSDLFEAKQQYLLNREGSRNNVTSAIVPIRDISSKSVYLGLYNPDDYYGIHYAIEVVAIVEETN